LYACSHRPEDGDVSGRNMLVTTVAADDELCSYKACSV